MDNLSPREIFRANAHLPSAIHGFAPLRGLRTHPCVLIMSPCLRLRTLSIASLSDSANALTKATQKTERPQSLQTRNAIQVVIPVLQLASLLSSILEDQHFECGRTSLYQCHIETPVHRPPVGVPLRGGILIVSCEEQ